MSPTNLQIYVANMAGAFRELAPEHAAEFDANAEAYQDELQQIQDDPVGEIATLRQSQWALVTCEGAFSFLAREAGLDEHCIWPVNAEQQATPQQITAAIETVREQDIPAVFCESTVSDAPMQQAVEATGTRFGGTLYVDSLSEEGGPVPAYLDLVRHDADTIVAGLTGEEG